MVLVSVARHDRLRGWSSPEDDANELLQVKELGEAVHGIYKTDAHMMMYAAADGSPVHRIRKAGVAAYPKSLVITAFLADWDTPNHVPWSSPMEATELIMKWREIPMLKNAGFFVSYRGARIIQPLAKPIPIHLAERYYNRWLADLRHNGVEYDPECKGLLRVWRLANVRRVDRKTGRLFDFISPLILLEQMEPIELEPLPEPEQQELPEAAADEFPTGAIVGTAAAITLLTIAVAALEITFTPVLIVFAAVVAAMGVMAGAAAALYLAYRSNLGGLKEFVDRTLGGVSLAFRALAQLFEDGVLSGAVLDELERTENEGVLAFVVKAWQFVGRMQAVWDGFKSGVQEALAFANPVFQLLTASIERLASAFGLAGTGIGDAVNGLPIDGFRRFGSIVGNVVGGILAVLAGLATGLVTTISLVAKGLEWGWAIISGIARAIGWVISWIGEKLAWVIDRFSEAGDWIGQSSMSTAPVQARGASQVAMDPAEAMSAMPAAAELESRSAIMEKALMSMPQASASDQSINITTALVVESETLARATYQANQREAARAFSPLPAFG